jgi:hypothetical protein
MGGGAAIVGAVVVLRDLGRSSVFYRELLGLDVEASSGEALLLSSRGGDRLALRRLSAAPHGTVTALPRLQLLTPRLAGRGGHRGATRRLAWYTRGVLPSLNRIGR